MHTGDPECCRVISCHYFPPCTSHPAMTSPSCGDPDQPSCEARSLSNARCCMRRYDDPHPLQRRSFCRRHMQLKVLPGTIRGSDSHYGSPRWLCCIRQCGSFLHPAHSFTPFTPFGLTFLVLRLPSPDRYPLRISSFFRMCCAMLFGVMRSLITGLSCLAFSSSAYDVRASSTTGGSVSRVSSRSFILEYSSCILYMVCGNFPNAGKCKNVLEISIFYIFIGTVFACLRGKVPKWLSG